MNNTLKLTRSIISSMNLPGEIWKNIKGFPDYSVSNMGRVFNEKMGKYIGKVTEGQYVKVGMKNSEGKWKFPRVHSLVAAAFLKNPEELPIVDHRNSNKHDNRVDNLRFCSYSQNSKWAANRKKLA